MDKEAYSIPTTSAYLPIAGFAIGTGGAVRLQLSERVGLRQYVFGTRARTAPELEKGATCGRYPH